MLATFLGLAGPIILSSLGPIYFGYEKSPYSAVIVWALACTVAFLWWARPSLKRALGGAPESFWFRSARGAVIVALVAVGFVGWDYLVYLLVRSISN
jgi:hypothetical protein